MMFPDLCAYDRETLGASYLDCLSDNSLYLDKQSEVRHYLSKSLNFLEKVSDVDRFVKEHDHVVSLAKNRLVGPNSTDLPAHLVTAIDEFVRALKARFETSPGNPVNLSHVLNARQQKYGSYHSDIVVRSKPILRINQIPFLESVYLKELSDELNSNGAFSFELVLVDIPWGEVGRALLNGQIDVAAYNDELVTQITKIRDTDQRYRSPFFDRYASLYPIDLFDYNKYYFISRKLNRNNNRFDITIGSKRHAEATKFVKGANKKRILAIGNSDYDRALVKLAHSFGWNYRELGVNKRSAEITGHYRKVRGKGRGAVRIDVDLLSDADEAVRNFADGNADLCMVGGMHAEYLLGEFPALFERLGSIKWSESESYGDRHVGADRTICRIWFPKRPSSDYWLKSINQAWLQVEKNLCSSGASTTGSTISGFGKATRDKWVSYLNSQNRAAFVLSDQAFEKALRCNTLRGGALLSPGD